MKSFQPWSILCLSLGGSEAFAPPSFGQMGSKSILMTKSIITHPTQETALFMSEDTEKKLTSQEIINKARKMSGLPVEEEEEEIKIFEPELLNDMKQCLLLLEKRVKDGPGSLTADEVTELAIGADRIAVEMNNFNSNLSTIDGTSPSTEVSDSQFESVNPAPSIEASWGGRSSQQASPGTVRVLDEESNTDEGPAYDGTGGMGLSRGTKNTYIIEGMDEMTPEEYRAALQKAVLDTQAQRRKIRRDVVGNRAAHDYLSTLGYGGTSKALSRGRDAEEE